MMSNMGTWILLVLTVLVGSSFGAGIRKKRANVNSVCASPSNTASLVVINFTLIPGGSAFSSYPLGYCDCNQGQQYFWNSTQDPLPLNSYRDNTLAQSLDSYQPNGCTDICVCDINGVCYKPEDSTNYNIDLVPYCNNSECYVYGAVYNRSLWIGEGGQVAYQEDGDIPVGINSPYLKIASIGCGGCQNLKNLNCSQTFTAVEYNDTGSNSDGGLWSSSSSFNLSSFDLSSIFESKEVKEVLCLIPADVIEFVENLTLLEVYKLFKLYPQFAEVMDPNQQITPEKLEEIIKNGAPTVYTKLEALLQPYKQKWEQMPLAAQDFLNDLGNATDKMKVVQSNSNENFPTVHEFFQGLYQNYTQLDNSSKTSIENFIPTMTHIIASPAFVGFLKNCSQAEDMSQLMEYGQTFNEYILAHACDAQGGLNNTTTQAKAIDAVTAELESKVQAEQKECGTLENEAQTTEATQEETQESRHVEPKNVEEIANDNRNYTKESPSPETQDNLENQEITKEDSAQDDEKELEIVEVTSKKVDFETTMENLEETENQDFENNQKVEESETTEANVEAVALGRRY